MPSLERDIHILIFGWEVSVSPVADLQTLGTPICSFSSCAVVEKRLWFSITARQIKTYPFSSYVHTCQTLPQDLGLSLACFKMKYDLLISINRPKIHSFSSVSSLNGVCGI